MSQLTPQRRGLIKSAWPIISEGVQVFNVVFGVSVLAGIAAIFAWISQNWFPATAVLVAPLGVYALATFAALGMVGLIIWKKPRAKRLIQGYRWLRVEYEYRIDSSDSKHHSQTIKIIIEALRHGVNHFENRYQWSGRGREEGPTVLSHGHRLIGPPIQRSIWKYYYVDLGRTLAPGDKEEVEIVQELYDTEGTFEPFLAKTIVEPVEFLVLRVLLPSGFNPSSIMAIESHLTPGDVPIRSLNYHFDDRTNEIRLEVRKPVYNHNYQIRWAL